VRDRSDTSAWNRRRRPPPKTVVDVADRVQIAAPADEVFPRLLDVEFVAGCLPGIVPGSLAALDDGAYAATVRQTVLGVPATWRLRVTIAPDPAQRAVAIGLSGDEQRLRMTMTGTAGVRVADGPPGTTDLDYDGHVEVEGRLAAAGGPVVRKLVGEILERFVGSLAG
jgi:carbon monoxide dehydrogenase subunit G